MHMKEASEAMEVRSKSPPALAMNGPDLDIAARGTHDLVEDTEAMCGDKSSEEPATLVECDDATGLFQHERHENDQRLRICFEQIFDKYARDFTDVGDEIDIETGEIVVNNGHLENMQHEVDPGDCQSLQFVKDFAEELEHEDETGDSEGNEGSEGTASELGTEAEEEEDYGEASAHAGTAFGALTQNPAPFALDPLLQELSHAAFPAELPEMSTTLSGVDDTTTPDAQGVPAVQSSMLSLISKAETDRRIGPEAIEALGVSIANQLAKYMVGSKGQAKGKKRKPKDTTWDFPELPAFKRQRTIPTHPARPHLPQLSTVLSPSGKPPKESLESIWAPARHPRYHPPKPSPLPPSPAKADDAAETNADHVPTESVTQDAHDSPMENGVPPLKECHHCQIRATITWRPGPDGHDLCNACGMYWYRYDLLRPLRREAPEPPSDDESSNKSRRSTNTGSRHTRFSIEEDALIIKLKEIDHLSWERIAHHFRGRSHYGVQCRYAKILVSQPSAGRDALIEQGFRFDEDSEAEEALREERDEQRDELLVQLRLEDELDWPTIAERIPGKAVEWVEKRFNVLVGNLPQRSATARRKKKKRANPVYANAPKHHYRVYTPDEDELLIKLREVDKLPWEILAQEFTQRTWLSLQKRYVRTLAQRHKVMRAGGDDPYTHVFLQADPDDGDFRFGRAGRKRMEEILAQRRDEDETLLNLKNVEGLSFGEIAERMPGRTVASLINRFEYLRDFNDSLDVPAPTSPEKGVSQGDDAGVEDLQQRVSLDALDARKSASMSARDQLIVRLRNEGDVTWNAAAAQLVGMATGDFVGNVLKTQDGDMSLIDPMLTGSVVVEGAATLSASETVVDIAEAPDAAPTETTSAFSTDRAAANRVNHYLPATPVSTDISQRANLDLPIEHSMTRTFSHYTETAKHGAQWTEAEHALLIKLRSKKMRWAAIASQLPGRSPNAVECRWNEYCKDVDVTATTPKTTRRKRKTSKSTIGCETTLSSTSTEDRTTLPSPYRAPPVPDTTPLKSATKPLQLAAAPSLPSKITSDGSRGNARSTSPSSPLTPLPPSTPIAADFRIATSRPVRGATSLSASTLPTTASGPAIYTTPTRNTQRAMPYFVALQPNNTPTSSDVVRHHQSTDPFVERSPDKAAPPTEYGLPNFKSTTEASEGADVMVLEATSEDLVTPHHRQRSRSPSSDLSSVPASPQLARDRTFAFGKGAYPSVDDPLPAPDASHAALPVSMRKCIGACHEVKAIADFTGYRSSEPVLRCLACRGVVLDAISGKPRKGSAIEMVVKTSSPLTQRSTDVVGSNIGVIMASSPPKIDTPRRTRGQIGAERYRFRSTFHAPSSPTVEPTEKTTPVHPPSSLSASVQSHDHSATFKGPGTLATLFSVPVAFNGLPCVSVSSPTVVQAPISAPILVDDAKPDCFNTDQIHDTAYEPDVAQASIASDMVYKSDIVPSWSTEPLQFDGNVEDVARLISTDPLQQTGEHNSDAIEPSLFDAVDLIADVIDSKPMLDAEVICDPESSQADLHTALVVAESNGVPNKNESVDGKSGLPLVEPEQTTTVPRSTSPPLSRSREQPPRRNSGRAAAPAYLDSLAGRSKRSSRKGTPIPLVYDRRPEPRRAGGAVAGKRKIIQLRANDQDSSEDELA
ncbi:hypothetical protein LTS09_006348 [Friedmanniomyces endolithicus]|nr:hypothetical protein LTS09_006348 [Friedmanniomyces endolithicus]